MPIEGPLRELGMHDVFQLLHLSRKTGMLTCHSDVPCHSERSEESASGGQADSSSAAPPLNDKTAALPPRNDKSRGFVLFESGRVIHAGMGSQPSTVEEMLVAAGRITPLDLEYARRFQTPGATILQVLLQAGAITPRELERQVRRQLESVVFELMAWRDGFFSFEERAVDDVSLETRVRLSTESLLMESARRIDEWARIADRVPSLSAVPVLADQDPGTRLDLAPQEWEVLALVNDARDVHGIAETLGRPAFEIAKTLSRLIDIGLVAIHAGVGEAA
jgi:hypothetical protein